MDQRMKEQIKLGVMESIANVREELRELQEWGNPVPVGRQAPSNGSAGQRPGLSCINKVRFRLTRLEQTLQNIDDPDFGRCVQCGRDIGVKCLQVRPETDVCGECADQKSFLTYNYLFHQT